MRGKVAKRLRREVYGDYSYRARSYHFKRLNRGRKGLLWKLAGGEEASGMIVADERRRAYQRAKREHRKKGGL